MMKTKGKIDAVEEKVASNGKNYKAYTISGKVYNCWKEELNKLGFRPNDFVIVDFTMNNKFKNIENMSKSENEDFDNAADSMVEDVDSSKAEWWERKQKIIVRQNCLGHATQLAIAFKVDKDRLAVIKAMAEELEEWVFRGDEA